MKGVQTLDGYVWRWCVKPLCRFSRVIHPAYGRGMCGGVVALKTQKRFVIEFLFSVLNTRNRTHSAGHTAHSIRIPLTRTELTSERFLHSTGIIIRAHQKETLRNEMWR